ncbi:uncharacterized protein RAG0_09695 [Rhynchosporium agropyri]|uniref:Uncharacterized protein n=1 Tax=Rhynchosporium agropyri TaxID=914238 RepID=A0A1E1KWQ1_9HELO|nr:uncharacterized protein RAG0_09695 [Rhynchosporium agropyri]
MNVTYFFPAIDSDYIRKLAKEVADRKDAFDAAMIGHTDLKLTREQSQLKGYWEISEMLLATGFLLSTSLPLASNEYQEQLIRQTKGGKNVPNVEDVYNLITDEILSSKKMREVDEIMPRQQRLDDLMDLLANRVPADARLRNTRKEMHTIRHELKRFEYTPIEPDRYGNFSPVLRDTGLYQIRGFLYRKINQYSKAKKGQAPRETPEWIAARARSTTNPGFDQYQAPMTPLELIIPYFNIAHIKEDKNKEPRHLSRDETYANLRDYISSEISKEMTISMIEICPGCKDRLDKIKKSKLGQDGEGPAKTPSRKRKMAMATAAELQQSPRPTKVIRITPSEIPAKDYEALSNVATGSRDNDGANLYITPPQDTCQSGPSSNSKILDRHERAQSNVATRYGDINREPSCYITPPKDAY